VYELILKGASADRRRQVSASGFWTAAHAASLEQKIEAIKSQASGSGTLEIDMSEIAELDTFGAWLIGRLARDLVRKGFDIQLVGVAERFRGLLGEIHMCGREKPAPAKQNPLLAKLEGLGRSSVESVQDLVRLADMLGALGSAMARALFRPQTFRC
jgi:phospholipid/cholesterol/gamma-HCH transport system permease protein